MPDPRGRKSLNDTDTQTDEHLYGLKHQLFVFLWFNTLEDF